MWIIILVRTDLGRAAVQDDLAACAGRSIEHLSVDPTELGMKPTRLKTKKLLGAARIRSGVKKGKWVFSITEAEGLTASVIKVQP